MITDTLFLKSQSATSPLRVGLLFPPGGLPPPATRVLEYLHACDFVEVVAAITGQSGSNAGSPVGPALYRLYRWLDQLTAPAITRALAPQDCTALLSEFTPYRVNSDPTDTYLLPSDIQRSALASCHLDVILALGSPPNPAELAQVAKFGVWMIRLGDPLLGDDQPRHFWNTIHQSAPLSISLDALIAGTPMSVTLASGTLSLATSISTVRNLIGSACMGAGLVLSTLWQLHSSGWDYVLARSPEPAVRDPSLRILPSNKQMLAWILVKSVRQIRHRIKLRHTGSIWRVAIRRGSQLEGLRAARAAAGLSWLEAPPGHYYADPFVISHDGRPYLFVEDFDLATDKGRISCIKIDQNGSPGPPKVALERPYHLSYPQILVHEGEVFMLPESGCNDTVEIYRAIEFPVRWELVRVLFNGPAFDTTVLHHDGLFWFFVTLIDTRYPQCALLVLFYSHSLLGDWTLHPASPISRDIRVARCAGSPFLDQGTWIRPAQDGSETYGGALRYQRILRVDTKVYREESAGTFTTQAIPGATGVHTYNRNGQLEVFDAKNRVILPNHITDLQSRNT
jgi:hypothetical protein